MITINYNYYNNLDLFKWVRDYYKALDTTGFHFTIIDDGSMDVPLPDALVPSDWSFYRVTEDVGWNCNGARNCLMKETQTKWNLNIDLDRVVAPQSLNFLKNHDLQEDTMYHFASLPHDRIATQDAKVQDYTWLLSDEQKNLEYKCAYNTYICTKELFWGKGKGYAELAHGGEYGGDYLFLDNDIIDYWKYSLVFFKEISIYCILFSMVAIGLQTNLKSMINLGFKPLIIGFIASATVGVVSVIYLY